MQYLSTRDSRLRVSAQEAIVRGLAPQSGLFVPKAFPKADLEGWKNLSYPELAEKVLAGFLTDYSAARSRSVRVSIPLSCGTVPPAPSRTTPCS